GGRSRDAAADDAGRADHAVPGLPGALLRPRLRATLAAPGLDPWRRGRESVDARARVGPRLPRRYADRGRRSFGSGVAARGWVRVLGLPRPTQGRSRRLTGHIRGSRRRRGRDREVGAVVVRVFAVREP